MNAGAGTPGGWAFPQAQQMFGSAGNLAEQFLTGNIFGDQTTPFNTYANQGLDASQRAFQDYQSMAYPGVMNNLGSLIQGGAEGLNFAGPMLGQAFDPMYSDIIGQTVNNPFYGQAMGGAQQGAALGGAGANQMYGGASALMQSGFDPQSALFNRTQGQVMDQAAAANAMSGLGSSPYGASTAANAMGNFDINWQNQQLARQAQAAGAASPLFQAAPGLATASAAGPSNVFTGQLGQILQALNARTKAGEQGALGYGSLLGASQNALAGGNQLGLGATQGLSTMGNLPYQTGANIGSNALTGMGNLQNLLSGATNIGNDQFKLPQQIMSDLMQYMGLGQNASLLSGQLGQMGFNQMSQGIGGALSGANTLFGNNGLLGGSGGLFGGSAAPTAGAGISGFGSGFIPATAGEFGDFSAMAAAPAASSSLGLGSLLPMAASA